MDSEGRNNSRSKLFHHHLLGLAQYHGRMLVFDRQTFPVQWSTYSGQVTTYVGKSSAAGQPTRPTKPFVLSVSISEY